MAADFPAIDFHRWLLGAVNGVFIALLKLPTLIVTGNTLSFRGFLYLCGVTANFCVASGHASFSRLMVARGTTEGGSFYALP